MDPPEGETPQAERTLNKNQNPGHGFPRGGDPADRERAVQHKSEP
jgi:hypothetical protein